MDIKCATCQEPWEHYHLLHDLPWDAWDGEDDSPSHLAIKRFKESEKTSIPPLLRTLLEEEGWKFGRTIVCVLECGCCGYGGRNDKQIEIRKGIRLEAEELLGSDLDGLISTLSSIDIYSRMEDDG